MITKKRGRPATGIGSLIGVRIHGPTLGALDAWIARQPDPQPTRPEAIRRFVENALASAEEVSDDASLDRQIAEQKAAIDEIPEPAGPSPEAALAKMDKAMAQNDLVELKNERKRRKNSKRK